MGERAPVGCHRARLRAHVSRTKPFCSRSSFHCSMYDTCSAAVEACLVAITKPSAASLVDAAHASSPLRPRPNACRSTFLFIAARPAGCSLIIECVRRPCCAFVASLLPRAATTAGATAAPHRIRSDPQRPPPCTSALRTKFLSSGCPNVSSTPAAATQYSARSGSESGTWH